MIEDEKIGNQTHPPPNKEDLIARGKQIHKRIDETMIRGYHEIGDLVNSFFKKEYGQDITQQIAEGIGISAGILRKACQFARQYSADQVDILFEGAFIMPWHAIIGNLSLEAAIVIDLYAKSTSVKEFMAKAKDFKKQQKASQVPDHMSPASEEPKDENLPAPSPLGGEQSCNPVTIFSGSGPAAPTESETGIKTPFSEQSGAEQKPEQSAKPPKPEAEGKKARLDSEFAELKDEIERLNQENETLREVYKTLKGENARLKDDIVNLNSRVEALELEIEELRDEMGTEMSIPPDFIFNERHDDDLLR